MTTEKPPLNIGDVLHGFEGAFTLNLKLMRDYYGLRSLEVMPEASSQLFLKTNDRPRTLFLPCDSIIGTHTFINKFWDPGKPKFFSNFSQAATEGIVLVDIGANVGLFSRQCLSIMPNIKATYCYEPHPGNFELLQRNIGGIANVHLFNYGVSRSNGSFTLYEDPNNVGNYSLNQKAMPPGYRESIVEIVGVSTQEPIWLQNRKPIFYKSDTQGHDEVIATSLSDEFWAAVKVGVFELWRLDGKNYDKDRFLSILDSFPFKVFEKAANHNATGQEVMEYLSNTDGLYDDLIFWR